MAPLLKRLFKKISIFVWTILYFISCNNAPHNSSASISSKDSADLMKQIIEHVELKSNISSSDTAEQKLQKAMRIAADNNFIYGQLWCLNYMYSKVNAYDKPDKIKLKLFRDIDSVYLLSRENDHWFNYIYFTSYLKGTSLKDQNEFDSAQYYFGQSIKYARGDSAIYYNSVYNLAALNFQSQHFASAKRYIQKLMQWSLKRADTPGTLKCMGMLAMSYAATGDSNNAFKCFDELGRWISTDTNRYLDHHSNRLYNLATYYSRLERNDSATFYYKRCLNLLQLYPDRFPYPLELTKLSFAQVLLNQKRTDEANQYFEEVKTLFDKEGYPDDIPVLISLYSVGYRICIDYNRYKEALYYLDNEKHAKDRQQNQELSQQLQVHERELKKLEAEKTIAQKDSQISRQKQLKTFWGSLATILGLSAFGIFINFKQKQKLNKINLQKEVLNSKLQERDRIAQEMHDDLGSTLTSLMMAVELYSANPENEQNKSRIDHISNELHHQINDVIWRINSGNDYIQNLSARIYKFARNFLSQAGIEMESSVHIPDELVGIQGVKRHLVYLTIKEILNNIVKHAKARKVSIDIAYANQLLTLTIKDDGTGFDAGQNEDTLSGNGLKNIKKNIEKTGGDVKWHNHNGTTVELSIPL